MYLLYCIVFASDLLYCACIVKMRSNETVIIGKKLFTIFENIPYAAFYNIPYAEPPIGDLRFKPPKIKPDSLGQQDRDYSEYYREGGIEDCLYLSIYMPMVRGMTKNFPVLVLITNNQKLAPDFFIEEDVIMVTVEHRTNIFGFLNTDDGFAEGNMGCKDVVTALKWIKENIAYFRGDKERITIFGHGDAAILAASMLVSPMARDLFIGAIILDDSALSPSDYRAYNFEIANKLYWKLKRRFDKFDRKELYECLRNMSSNDLFVLSRNLYDSSEVRNNQRVIKSFTCSIESTKKYFINRNPVEFYESENVNNVKAIFGYTNLVSLHQLQGLARNSNLLRYLTYNFQYLLPFAGKPDEFDSKRYKRIRNDILEFYFLNGTLTERSLRRYAKYVSDQVLYPLLRQAGLQSEVSPVYLCRFSYKGSLNLGWSSSVPELRWRGATLGDEICYLFRCKFKDEVYTSAEFELGRKFVTKIVGLFANFVKCGNPTPDRNFDNLTWYPFDKKNKQALNLNRRIRMVKIPEAKRMQFWDDLKIEYFDK